MESARRQPLPEKTRPGSPHLGDGPAEAEHGIRASRDHRAEVPAGENPVRWDLHASVVAAARGPGDRGVVVADSDPGASEQVVRRHPGIYRALPELGQLGAIGPDVTEVGDGCIASLDELGVHGSLRGRVGGGSTIGAIGRGGLIRIAELLIRIAVLAKMGAFSACLAAAFPGAPPGRG